MTPVGMPSPAEQSATLSAIERVVTHNVIAELERLADEWDHLGLSPEYVGRLRQRAAQLREERAARREATP